MKYIGIAVVSMFAIGLVTTIMVVSTVFGTLNREVVLKQDVQAQEKKQIAAYDKLWKKIAQETQITNAESSIQKELVASLVSGRQASFIKLIQESNPETVFNKEQFNRLSNIVQSERDGLFREQTVLISKVQVYNTYYESVISGFILRTAGRKQIPEPILITSEQTQEIAKTGKDNNVQLELK